MKKFKHLDMSLVFRLQKVLSNYGIKQIISEDYNSSTFDYKQSVRTSACLDRTGQSANVIDKQW